MDKDKRKELVNAWKNRIPDMGIISIRCKTTGDSFLGASKDINADFNSAKCKLSTSWHPNKKLLELWKTYGEEDFEFFVLERVECKDPTEDYTDKLEKLREKYLEADEKSQKIWR